MWDKFLSKCNTPFFFSFCHLFTISEWEKTIQTTISTNLCRLIEENEKKTTLGLQGSVEIENKEYQVVEHPRLQ